MDPAERDAARQVLGHIAEASWPLRRLAAGDGPGRAEADRDAAAAHLESFIVRVDRESAVRFPPEVSAAARAALAALLARDYVTAKREAGRAGSLTEIFLAHHYGSDRPDCS